MAYGPRGQRLSLPTTVNWVAPGTSVKSGTPILETYGNPKNPYSVDNAGTVNVTIALDATSSFTVSHNATDTSASYNSLNGGSSLPATTEYAFGIPVRPGEKIDFELGTSVTLNVFDVWFVSRQ